MNRKISSVLKLREERQMTQEELAEKSGVSVRTIQRLEAGGEPKGHTLKALSQAFEVPSSRLLVPDDETDHTVRRDHKLFNFGILIGSLLPPLNLVLPLGIAWYTRRFDKTVKALFDFQILWTLLALALFLGASFLNKELVPSRALMPLVMATIVLSNLVIALVNAASLDRKDSPAIRLPFSIL